MIHSITTGPSYSIASLIAAETSSLVVALIALHPSPSATLQKSTLSDKIVFE